MATLDRAARATAVTSDRYDALALKPSALRGAALLVVAWLLQSPVVAQDPCVDCHLAQQREEERVHLDEWRDSSHARANVGCSDCHGGDNSTFVQVRAHRGVLNSVSPEAPTNRQNLPTTCGTCHGSILRALQESHHWTMFEAGSVDAPTCYTCHEALGVKTLGTGGLSARCSSCHGADAEYPRVADLGRAGEVVRRGRELIELRAKVRRLVLAVADSALRHEAGNTYFAASNALNEAIEAGHAFDYDGGQAALDLAERLLSQLQAGLEQRRP